MPPSLARLDRVPQTNAVRWSVALIAVARWPTSRHGLPLVLSERGASAGLNLMFDRPAPVVAWRALGCASAALTLTVLAGAPGSGVAMAMGRLDHHGRFIRWTPPGA